MNTATKENTGSRWSAAPLAAAAAAVVAALATATVAAAQDDEAAGPCARISKSMRTACGNEVRDDFWVELAKCTNETTDRKDCRRDAKEGRDEGLEECAAQYDARNEVCVELGPARYDPEIDPADFVTPEEAAASPNPFLPLIPGAEWVYEDDEEVVTVTVTGDTKEILGVTCVVVHDVVTVDGEPVEDTVDWFAQDADGNVWYFGEIAQNFEDGELSDLEGSWEAGKDGAKPGISVPAMPEVGDFYRQEFLLGDAEDVAEVLSLTGDETSPAADCGGACLVTAEWTPLEPDALEYKHYVPGIGFILEVDGESGERGIELVSVTIP